MNKAIYLLRGSIDESYSSFRERIRNASTRISLELLPQSLWFTITESPPPAISVIPFSKGKLAAISIVGRLQTPIDLLISEPGFSGAYYVDEALPVSYSRSWEAGTVTPGVCLLTLFRRKNGLDYKTFLHRWHYSHTPLSLRIHPLWHYNRNVVTKPLAPDSEPWEGIVEEHMKTRSDLLNPFRFFGNPLVIVPRMIEVYRDTRSFLDYKTIEPYFVQEYYIK